MQCNDPHINALANDALSDSEAAAVAAVGYVQDEWGAMAEGGTMAGGVCYRARSSLSGGIMGGSSVSGAGVDVADSLSGV